MKYTVDKKGFYGNYGGAFVPEMLFPNLDELEKKRYYQTNWLRPF